ncbi:hypothetical protein LV780_04945 [Cereibacter azotoformans]|uniref:hypothetical protein n=1 Tax=Cereibacter azotoformans TaxID=43057 RepID=UPI000E360CC1|nr:hypothetical protein [Cereibacter azotoformans]AXQ93214.1 hypothetical protein D0Z66_04935 [Cereibacter sphaeroides]UIJ31528.1 hypothetical protein LV780_04945 [Cereibacter azotoformans]
MPDSGPGAWETVLLSGSMIAAWIGGEAGRVAVAGGAGGLMRWLAAEQRRIRDGVLAERAGVVHLGGEPDAEVRVTGGAVTVEWR